MKYGLKGSTSHTNLNRHYLDVNEVICSNCRKPYPVVGVSYHCEKCGGTFDYSTDPDYDPIKVETKLPGIWKYRYTFGLPLEAPVISLGEGNTPLVWSKVERHKIAFKLEYLNPSGSFKDRGSAVLMSFLKAHGVLEAVEDSSGNAGASFAAYAARGGIKGRVFIPASTSGPKRDQISAYGAEIIAIPGPRSSAAEAVLREVDSGKVYASHSYLPFGLRGYSTIAYELVDQLGCAPGTVVVPVGHGSLLLGIGRGFLSLVNGGVIDQMPRLIGVQAIACAPIWALFVYGPAGSARVEEGETLAEGIRVRHPVRGDMLLRMVATSQGNFLAVTEAEILSGCDELGRRGFYVEPTAAVVWQALKDLAGKVSEPIVAILTGTGLKHRAQQEA